LIGENHARAIVNAAAQSGCEVICSRPHRRRDFAQLFLGGVTAKVSQGKVSLGGADARVSIG
ncbi:MAG: hypothetical protein ACOVN2_00760, partial [Usitatibacteraceae bacterium]